MKITFLGTSGSTPTRYRGLSSVAVDYEKDILLFDCGEATQMQMMKYGLNISKVRAIFLTHIHGDHVIGLAGLARTLALNGRTSQLDIFIPQTEIARIKQLITFDRAKIKYQIKIHAAKSGEILKTDKYIVSGFKLDHSVDTFGYTFIENDKIHFIKDKCNKLGIKGTMFSTLEKNGSIKIAKRTIKLKDVITKEKGKKIVYATDTRPCSTTINVAKSADILIHEATYADQLKDYAKARKHSTAPEAAQIAKKAAAKKLILTHISARYRQTSQMLKEAKKIFPNTQIAEDGLAIIL